MRATLWGTRGSVARAGPDTVRYGGDTACIELRTGDGRLVILDAGSGLPRLARGLGPDYDRIDIFLTHLHMDHIQGLGFFTPLFDPESPKTTRSDPHRPGFPRWRGVEKPRSSQRRQSQAVPARTRTETVTLA